MAKPLGVNIRTGLPPTKRREIGVLFAIPIAEFNQRFPGKTPESFGGSSRYVCENCHVPVAVTIESLELIEGPKATMPIMMVCHTCLARPDMDICDLSDKFRARLEQ